MHRAFTYRLSPTVKQGQALGRLMHLQCELYNAALEERRMTYEWNRRGISSVRAPSRFDQFKTLTGLAELRPVACKSGLNDAIMDAGWARLISMLNYKAADAGRKIIAVNPRHTSQRCSACWHVARENRDKQKFACVSCGFTEHADINAARNILRAGLAHGGSGAHPAIAEPVNQ
jgi:Putative transposase DNA-binding domain/Helix-turn-helix domain